ncbi:MAG: hypothetical protein ACJ76N_05055 [Thermoanaerobaculia bacterium]|jgi:hypothetical protein
MKLSRSVRMAGAMALLLGALGAAPALACSTCYGAADSGSPLVSGARLGVFLLLAVTAAVLGAFAKFFFYLRNRARQAEIEQITSEWAQFQRSSST